MGAWGSLPAVHASDLRSGDLVLVRKQVHTSVGSLQPGLIRGVVSTSRGAYFSVQRQSLSGWTHVAMVLQHEQRLWLCEPGISGLKLSPLIARLRELKSDGSHYVVRRLIMQRTDGRHEVFNGLLDCAARGIRWAPEMPRYRASRQPVSREPGSAPTPPELQSIGEHAPGFRHREVPDAGKGTKESRADGKLALASDGREDDASSVRSGGTSATAGTAPPMWRTMGRYDLTPFGRKLVHMLLPRVWAAVRQVPPQVAVEVHRSFIRADQDRSGFIEASEVRSLLSDIRGKSVSEADARGFLRLVDTDGDGVLSEAEVLMGLARLPQKRIPVEHDLEGVVAGELIASVLELLGVMQSRVSSTLQGGDLAQALLDQATGAGSVTDTDQQVRRAPGPATVVPMIEEMEMGGGEMPPGANASGGRGSPSSRGGSLHKEGSFLLSSSPVKRGGLFTLVGQVTSSRADDDGAHVGERDMDGAKGGGDGGRDGLGPMRPGRLKGTGRRRRRSSVGKRSDPGDEDGDRSDMGEHDGTLGRGKRSSVGRSRRSTAGLATASLDPEELARRYEEADEAEEKRMEATAAMRRARHRALKRQRRQVAGADLRTVVVIDANTGAQQHYLPVGFASSNRTKLPLTGGAYLETESTVIMPVLRPPPPQPLGLTGEYPYEPPVEDRRSAWERKQKEAATRGADDSSTGHDPAGTPAGSAGHAPGDVDDDEDHELVMRPRISCVGGLCGPHVSSGRPSQEHDEEFVHYYWRDKAAEESGDKAQYQEPLDGGVAAARNHKTAFLDKLLVRIAMKPSSGRYATENNDSSPLTSATLTIEINEADLRPLARAIHVAQALAEHVEYHELKERDMFAAKLRDHQRGGEGGSPSNTSKGSSYEYLDAFDNRYSKLVAEDKAAANRWRSFKQWARRAFQKRSRLLRAVLGAEVVATFGVGRESTQTTRRAARVAINTRQSALSPRANDIEHKFSLLRDESQNRMESLESAHEEQHRMSTHARPGMSYALRDQEALIDGLARMADPMDAICAGVAGSPKVARGAWAVDPGTVSPGIPAHTRRGTGGRASTDTRLSQSMSPRSAYDAGAGGGTHYVMGSRTRGRLASTNGGPHDIPADVVLAPMAAPGQIMTSIDVEDALVAKRLLVGGPLCPSTIVGAGIDAPSGRGAGRSMQLSVSSSGMIGPAASIEQDAAEEDMWFEARSWGARLWRHQLDAMLHGGPPSFVLLHDALLQGANSNSNTNSSGPKLAQNHASRQVAMLRKKLEQVGGTYSLGMSGQHSSQRTPGAVGAGGVDYVSSLAAPASLRIDAKAVRASTRTKIAAIRSGVDSLVAHRVASGRALHESKHHVAVQYYRRGSVSSVASLDAAARSLDMADDPNRTSRGLQSNAEGFAIAVAAESGRSSAEPRPHGLSDPVRDMHRRGSIAAYHHDLKGIHAGITDGTDNGLDDKVHQGVRFTSNDELKPMQVARGQQIAARSARHRRGSIATALLAAVYQEHAAAEEADADPEDVAIGLQLEISSETRDQELYPRGEDLLFAIKPRREEVLLSRTAAVSVPQSLRPKFRQVFRVRLHNFCADSQVQLSLYSVRGGGISAAAAVLGSEARKQHYQAGSGGSSGRLASNRSKGRLGAAIALDDSDEEIEFDETKLSSQESSRPSAFRSRRRSSVALPEEDAILQGASPRIGAPKHSSDGGKQLLIGTCVLHVGVAVFGHRLFAAAAAEEVTQRAVLKDDASKRSISTKGSKMLQVFGSRSRGSATSEQRHYAHDLDSYADGSSTISGDSRGGDGESEQSIRVRGGGVYTHKQSAMERRSTTIKLGDVPQSMPVHGCSDPHSNVFGPALSMGDVSSNGGAVALASSMPVGFTAANGGVPDISAHNWVEVAARADLLRAKKWSGSSMNIRPAALDTWLPLRPSTAVLEALYTPDGIRLKYPLLLHGALPVGSPKDVRDQLDRVDSEIDVRSEPLDAGSGESLSVSIQGSPCPAAAMRIKWRMDIDVYPVETRAAESLYEIGVRQGHALASTPLPALRQLQEAFEADPINDITAHLPVLEPLFRHISSAQGNGGGESEEGAEGLDLQAGSITGISGASILHPQEGITENEFVGLLTRLSTLPQEAIVASFHRMDADSSQTLSFAEYVSFLLREAGNALAVQRAQATYMIEAPNPLQVGSSVEAENGGVRSNCFVLLPVLQGYAVAYRTNAVHLWADALQHALTLDVGTPVHPPRHALPFSDKPVDFGLYDEKGNVVTHELHGFSASATPADDADLEKRRAERSRRLGSDPALKGMTLGEARVKARQIVATALKPKYQVSRSISKTSKQRIGKDRRHTGDSEPDGVDRSKRTTRTSGAPAYEDTVGPAAASFGTARHSTSRVDGTTATTSVAGLAFDPVNLCLLVLTSDRLCRVFNLSRYRADGAASLREMVTRHNKLSNIRYGYEKTELRLDGLLVQSKHLADAATQVALSKQVRRSQDGRSISIVGEDVDIGAEHAAARERRAAALVSLRDIAAYSTLQTKPKRGAKHHRAAMYQRRAMGDEDQALRDATAAGADGGISGLGASVGATRMNVQAAARRGAALGAAQTIATRLLKQMGGSAARRAGLMPGGSYYGSERKKVQPFSLGVEGAIGFGRTVRADESIVYIKDPSDRGSRATGRRTPGYGLRAGLPGIGTELASGRAVGTAVRVPWSTRDLDDEADFATPGMTDTMTAEQDHVPRVGVHDPSTTTLRPVMSFGTGPGVPRAVCCVSIFVSSGFDERRSLQGIIDRVRRGVSSNDMPSVSKKKYSDSNTSSSDEASARSRKKTRRSTAGSSDSNSDENSDNWRVYAVGDSAGCVGFWRPSDASMHGMVNLSCEAVTYLLPVPGLGLLCAGLGGPLEAVDVRNCVITKRFEMSHPLGITALAWCESERCVVTCGFDRRLLLWDAFVRKSHVAELGEAPPSASPQEAIVDVAVNDVHHQVLTLTKGGRLTVWDPRTLRQLQVVQDNLSRRSAGLAVDMQRLAVVTFGSHVRAWRVREVELNHETAAKAAVRAVAAAPGSALAKALQEDRDLMDAIPEKRGDRSDGLMQLEEHKHSGGDGDEVDKLALRTRARRGSIDERALRNYRDESSEKYRVLRASDADTVMRVLYSSAFDQVVTVRYGGRVAVIDIRTGSVVTSFRVQHRGTGTDGSELRLGATSRPAPIELTCASLDAQGRRLLTGAVDGSIRLWNLSNGAPNRRLVSIDSELTCACYHPAGGLSHPVVGGAWGGLVSFWRDEGGEEAEDGDKDQGAAGTLKVAYSNADANSFGKTYANESLSLAQPGSHEASRDGLDWSWVYKSFDESAARLGVRHGDSNATRTIAGVPGLDLTSLEAVSVPHPPSSGFRSEAHVADDAGAGAGTTRRAKALGVSPRSSTHSGRVKRLYLPAAAQTLRPSDKAPGEVLAPPSSLTAKSAQRRMRLYTEKMPAQQRFDGGAAERLAVAAAEQRRQMIEAGYTADERKRMRQNPWMLKDVKSYQGPIVSRDGISAAQRITDGDPLQPDKRFVPPVVRSLGGDELLGIRASSGKDGELPGMPATGRANIGILMKMRKRMAGWKRSARDTIVVRHVEDEYKRADEASQEAARRAETLARQRRRSIVLFSGDNDAAAAASRAALGSESASISIDKAVSEAAAAAQRSYSRKANDSAISFKVPQPPAKSAALVQGGRAKRAQTSHKITNGGKHSVPYSPVKVPRPPQGINPTAGYLRSRARISGDVLRKGRSGDLVCILAGGEGSTSSSFRGQTGPPSASQLQRLSWLATGSSDGQLVLWNPVTLQTLFVHTVCDATDIGSLLPASVESLAEVPYQGLLLAGTAGGSIHAMHLQTGKFVPVPLHSRRMSSPVRKQDGWAALMALSKAGGPTQTKNRRFGEVQSPPRSEADHAAARTHDSSKVRTGFKSKPTSQVWSGDSRQAVTAMYCDALGHVLFVGYENGCARLFDIRNLQSDAGNLLHPVKEWRVAAEGQPVRSITYALPKDGSKIPVFITAAGLDVVLWNTRGDRLARIGQSQAWPGVLYRDARGQRIARASLALGLTQGFEVAVSRLSDLAKRKATARIRAEASIQREQRLKKEDDKQRTLQQMRARRGSVTLRRPTMGQRHALQGLLAGQSQDSDGGAEAVFGHTVSSRDSRGHRSSKDDSDAISEVDSKLTASIAHTNGGVGVSENDDSTGPGMISPEQTVRRIHMRAEAKVGPMRDTEPLRYTLDTPDIYRVVSTYAVDTWRGGPNGRMSPRRMERDAQRAGFVMTKLRYSADEAQTNESTGALRVPGKTSECAALGRASPSGGSLSGSGSDHGSMDDRGDSHLSGAAVMELQAAEGVSIPVRPAGPASRLVAPPPAQRSSSSHSPAAAPNENEARTANHRRVSDLNHDDDPDAIFGLNVDSDLVRDPSDIATSDVRQLLEHKMQPYAPYRRAARVGFEYLGEAHWRRLPADSAINKPRWAAEKRRIEAQRGLLARRSRAILREGEIQDHGDSLNDDAKRLNARAGT